MSKDETWSENNRDTDRWLEVEYIRKTAMVEDAMNVAMAGVIEFASSHLVDEPSEEVMFVAASRIAAALIMKG